MSDYDEVERLHPVHGGLRKHHCKACGHTYESLHIIHCPVEGCECFCGGHLPEPTAFLSLGADGLRVEFDV